MSPSSAATSWTDELSEFISGARVPLESPVFADLALRPFIDTIGCMVAGVKTAPGQSVIEYLGGNGSQALTEGWSYARRGMDRERPALLLGTIGSALDYDDVSAVGHPSSVLVASVLASGPDLLSIESALEAYIIGYEVSTRLGQAMMRTHMKHGWHATSTTGFFGATATASRLLQLDASQVRHALGIAASMAAGILRNIGTATKPMHSGLAARGGVAAAEMARLGVDASASALDGAQGFLEMYGLGDVQAAAFDGLGDRWAMDERAPSLKKFPSCYATHRPIDAALQLRAAHDLDPQEIVSVEVFAPESVTGLLTFLEPQNGLQAKFSPTYPVATALLDGTVTIDSFLDDVVTRTEARDLIKRMTVSEDPRCSPAHGASMLDGGFWEIQVRTRQGNTLTARCEEAPGTPNRQLTWAEIETKFLDCCRSGDISRERAGAAFDALGDTVNCTDLRAVLARLSGATDGPSTSGEETK